MANILIKYKYLGYEEKPGLTCIDSEYKRVWLEGSEEIEESKADERIEILQKVTDEFGNKVYMDITKTNL